VKFVCASIPKISRLTALYFWEHYPSRKYLRGKTAEDLRKELVPVSHNKCSTKTYEKILDAVASDKVKNNAYQDARDMVTLSIMSDLQHYDKQLAEVDWSETDIANAGNYVGNLSGNGNVADGVAVFGEYNG